jgi:hypothetical protein
MLAICLTAVGTASATQPKFVGSGKTTSKSGAGVLQHTLTSETIECTGDESVTGEITGELTATKVQVKFTGCKGVNGTKTCKARSTGKEFSGKAGEIITATVKGELGEVAASEATSGAGILFTPESGTAFTEVEGETSGCLTKAPVTGSLAGEVSPLNVSAKTGKIIFRGKGGSQSIKSITIMGTHHAPELKALSGLVTVSENTEEEVFYTNNIEVT